MFHQFKTELKDNTSATFMWTQQLKLPEGNKE